MKNRMINSAFFDDSTIGKLSNNAKLLFILMWQMADDYGVMDYDDSGLSRKLILNIEETKRCLIDLISERLVIDHIGKVSKKRLLIIKNFLLYQRLDHPTDSTLISANELIAVLKKYNPEHLPSIISRVGKKIEAFSKNFDDNSKKIELISSLIEEKGIEENINESKLNTDYEIPAEFLENVKLIRNYISENEFRKGLEKKAEISDQNLVKLLQSHSYHFVTECIKRLYSYIQSSGKRYKNEYMAINSWVIEEVNKKTVNPKLNNKERINYEEGESRFPGVTR